MKRTIFGDTKLNNYENTLFLWTAEKHKCEIYLPITSFVFSSECNRSYFFLTLFVIIRESIKCACKSIFRKLVLKIKVNRFHICRSYIMGGFVYDFYPRVRMWYRFSKFYNLKKQNRSGVVYDYVITRLKVLSHIWFFIAVG